MFIDEEGSNAYALRWVSDGVIFIPNCIEAPNPGNESVARVRDCTGGHGHLICHRVHPVGDY